MGIEAGITTFGQKVFARRFVIPSAKVVTLLKINCRKNI